MDAWCLFIGCSRLLYQCFSPIGCPNLHLACITINIMLCKSQMRWILVFNYNGRQSVGNCLFQYIRIMRFVNSLGDFLYIRRFHPVCIPTYSSGKPGAVPRYVSSGWSWLLLVLSLQHKFKILYYAVKTIER